MHERGWISTSNARVAGVKLQNHFGARVLKQDRPGLYPIYVAKLDGVIVIAHLHTHGLKLFRDLV